MNDSARPVVPRVVWTRHTCWGAARVAGTRITTATLETVYSAGDTIEAIAEAYGIADVQVCAAIAFERRLSARHASAHLRYRFARLVWDIADLVSKAVEER